MLVRCWLMGVPWAGEGTRKSPLGYWWLWLPGWCWAVSLDTGRLVCFSGGVARAELACLIVAPCPGVPVGVDTYSVYVSCGYLGE